jgi:hypothetical protein
MSSGLRALRPADGVEIAAVDFSQCCLGMIPHVKPV